MGAPIDTGNTSVVDSVVRHVLARLMAPAVRRILRNGERVVAWHFAPRSGVLWQFTPSSVRIAVLFSEKLLKETVAQIVR